MSVTWPMLYQARYTGKKKRMWLNSFSFGALFMHSVSMIIHSTQSITDFNFLYCATDRWKEQKIKWKDSLARLCTVSLSRWHTHPVFSAMWVWLSSSTHLTQAMRFLAGGVRKELLPYSPCMRGDFKATNSRESHNKNSLIFCTYYTF